MKDFTIITPTGGLTKEYDIASATVIEKWDLIALTSGLATKAVAVSTAIAYAIWKSDVWDTKILVSVEPELVLEWTWSAAFAAAMKGTEVDITGTTTQLIDVWTSVTKVLKILPSEDAGTVWDTEKIRVKINKPLY